MGMFSRRSAGYLVMAAGLALTLTGPSLAQSQGQGVTIRDQTQLVESLRSGGYVIVVRHGATFSDQADTDPFNFDNIAKQSFCTSQDAGADASKGQKHFSHHAQAQHHRCLGQELV